MEWNAYLVAIRFASDTARVHIIERRYLEPPNTTGRYSSIKTCYGVELKTSFDESQQEIDCETCVKPAGLLEAILVWMARKYDYRQPHWNGQTKRGMARESQKDGGVSTQSTSLPGFASGLHETPSTGLYAGATG